MSNNHNDRSADQQLDRHIAALRDETIEAGPSNETIAATLAMIRGKTQPASGRRHFIERLAVMSFAQRIAAVVMITLGALTIYMMFALFNSLAPSVAFADVAQKFKAARTLQFTSTVALPGHPSHSMKMLLAEPDRTRTEMSDGMYTINSNHVTLVLDPRNKTASRIDLTGIEPGPADPEHNVISALRGLGELKGEPIGEKTIDGVVSAGFRTAAGERKMTVWADKKTASPVRVEMLMNVGAGEATIVMDHFIIDQPLDDSLFSLEPPQGYKLSTQSVEMPELGDVDVEVAKLLKMYTDASGGEFPPALADWAAYIKLKSHGVTDMQLATRVGAVSGLLFSLQDGYGYAGKGVKIGDKVKIVFWYKPESSDKYRAIFGDLRIEDVKAEQLPATQPAK